MARAPALETLPPAMREVWVPAGQWRDLWTGDDIQGPAAVTLPTALHQIPMLARAGAIVPLGPVPTHTGEAIWDPLTWEVFVPAEPTTRQFTLYEDDGDSREHQRGMWARTTVHVQAGPQRVSIRFDAPDGGLARRVLERPQFLRAHLPCGTAAAAVTAPGSALPRVTPPPDMEADPTWWCELPRSPVNDRRTPLSLSPADPVGAGDTTLLVRLSPTTREIHIDLRPDPD